MKNPIVYILILIVGVAIGWWGNDLYRFADGVNQNAKMNEELKHADVFQLDFYSFLYDFSTDLDFQKKHIKFPLPITETIVEKNEHFHYSVEDTVFTQVPEDLELAIHYTDNLDYLSGSRIIQNDDYIYFFAFKESAWFLIRFQKLLR